MNYHACLASRHFSLALNKGYCSKCQLHNLLIIIYLTVVNLHYQCLVTTLFIIALVHFHPGSVRTPIALHCGSFIFNEAVKAAEIGKF